MLSLIIKNIEPFNIPPVNNNDAAKFMKHLSGNESFEFDGNVNPLSLMIFDLNYQYPNYTYAYGLLLSIDVDTFYCLCNNLVQETMEIVIKKYGIGKIKIDFGGHLDVVRVSANSLSL